MPFGVDIARIASLIGDPGRANMLALLMDGRSHTASELATAAGVTRSTASGHLARLQDGELVSVVKSGRHRYYRLASHDVASMLENLMLVAGSAAPVAARVTPRVPDELREARSCYDHIAGRLGVNLADAFVRCGAVAVEGEVALITTIGLELSRELGLDLAAEKSTGRAKCRLCLDWSERKPHLAGVLGAELMKRGLEARWIERVDGTRAIKTTYKGTETFKALLHMQGHASK